MDQEKKKRKKEKRESEKGEIKDSFISVQQRRAKTTKTIYSSLAIYQHKVFLHALPLNEIILHLINAALDIDMISVHLSTNGFKTSATTIKNFQIGI